MNEEELITILKKTGKKQSWRISYTPEQIKEIFLCLHNSDVDNSCYSSESLDKLLSINYKADEHASFGDLRIKYGNQEFWESHFPGATGIFQSPYPSVKYFFQRTEPKKGQVVYDLGSGFGRVVFYGGLVTGAFIKGIEIVPARVDECNRVKEKLKLENISFTHANVLDVDFSDGNVFFMYHPFSEKTGYSVFEKLRKISEQKTITIAVNLKVYGLEVNRSWLKRTNQELRGDITIFKSVQ